MFNTPGTEVAPRSDVVGKDFQGGYLGFLCHFSPPEREKSQTKRFGSRGKVVAISLLIITKSIAWGLSVDRISCLNIAIEWRG